MIDVVENLIHWYAGRSQHELSASLGADRKTVRKYMGTAVAARRVGRRWPRLTLARVGV